MTASDQNSNMPLLRNDFSKIFEDLFTMTWFAKLTHIYDDTKNQKLKLKTEFHVLDILKLSGCKMSLTKYVS